MALFYSRLWAWHASREHRAKPNAMQPIEQLNIHLVDDDLFTAALYGKHLKGLGYERVTLFHDGVQCLEWLDREPDVIFLDHQMEPWNGVEVLKRIKRNSPHVHVVLLSGQEDVKVAVDALKYGAFDYVVKGDGDLERIKVVLDKIIQVRALLTKEKRSLKGRIARAIAGNAAMF
jgi:DNA-binding NtrC family response regulator